MWLPAVCFPAQIFALKVARCLCPLNAELRALTAGTVAVMVFTPRARQKSASFKDYSWVILDRWPLGAWSPSAAHTTPPWMLPWSSSRSSSRVGHCRSGLVLRWDTSLLSKLHKQTALSASMSVHPNPTLQLLNTPPPTKKTQPNPQKIPTKNPRKPKKHSNIQNQPVPIFQILLP